MRNQDFMDALNMLSFMYGVANYQENLTQNDKAELMQKLDQQTSDILTKLQNEIETQNSMLEEIRETLKRLCENENRTNYRLP